MKYYQVRPNDWQLDLREIGTNQTKSKYTILVLVFKAQFEYVYYKKIVS